MIDLNTIKKKAFRKLSRLKNNIYRKELGVILVYNLDELSERNFNPNQNKKDYGQVVFKKSQNIDEIFSFYNRVKKNNIEISTIKKWIEQGNDCWLIYAGDKVIGGTWVIMGQMEITQLTEHWLSKDKTITFDNNTVYRGYTIIDSGYRGRGIYQNFNHYILKYYYQKNKIDKMLFITRASNAAVISTTMKNNGKLIGIVEVRNILGWIYRKEFFLNKKEKSWF